MREFIGIVGILKIDEEELLDTREVVLEETSHGNSNSIIISPSGERVILESVDDDCGEHVIIQTDVSEFDAQWNGTITQEAANRLVEMINESQDYEVYYLNNMTFMMKRQAIAAVNSLARHP